MYRQNSLTLKFEEGMYVDYVLPPEMSWLGRDNKKTMELIVVNKEAGGERK